MERYVESYIAKFPVNAKQSIRFFYKSAYCEIQSQQMDKTPNPSLNADVPCAGLRPCNGPPVSLIR